MRAKVLGKNYTTKDTGISTTTLHLAEEFPAYFSDSEAHRHCEGMMVEAVYVGQIDCSEIKIGDMVEILYGKAVPMKNGGFFQTVESVKVVNNK